MTDRSSAATAFLDAALTAYGYSSLDAASSVIGQPAAELEPVPIADAGRVSAEETEAIRRRFSGRHRAVAFRVDGASFADPGAHPLIRVVSQLGDAVGAKHKIVNPADTEDGTGKLSAISTPSRPSLPSSNRGMPAHQDGLLLNGLVAVTGLMAENSSLTRCYTYSQNVVTLSFELARHDVEAFESLFGPPRSAS